MIRKRLIQHLISLMFFIFLANFFILKFYWYSLIWYLDIIMHLLGGFWVGLFFLYIFSRKQQVYFNLNLILKIFFVSFLVGFLWELYEFYLNVVSGTIFNFNDTISDLCFDLLGSIVSILYFFKIIMSERINKVQWKNG
ncbi:hypothetical protein COU49_01815 [Candidatus Nomurabacteria bacterium CG10_big_fil_rev_8_21_14_0_10_35_16]|uniref:VanZ-like domain-containing protein n=1 Tax=Candidatus Nomurabacteria bacterium CG10_big_fil_rev_8_21_14_0_10_35_16 TaxID=1974731 RepID=A0A2H0TDE1_9BACT|nr:MAG: hypothetical protein COU49_01815 [Candidatus Nomurabacteria bacterium CG10_big_fil_rev_8_21_14_0_10_35_16]